MTTKTNTKAKTGNAKVTDITKLNKRVKYRSKAAVTLNSRMMRMSTKKVASVIKAAAAMRGIPLPANVTEAGKRVMINALLTAPEAELLKLAAAQKLIPSAMLERIKA